MPPGIPSYGTHLTLRLEQDRVMAPDRASRLILARTVLDWGLAAGLIAFRAADTHLHVIVHGPGDVAARLVSRLESGLRCGVPFEKPRFKPIDDLWHMESAVLYVLRQAKRHGVAGDPWHESGNLPDLLGARTTGSYTASNLARWLPRLGDAGDSRLWDILGGKPPDPETRLDGTALPWIAEAAASAVGLPSILLSRHPEAISARAAAVQVLRDDLSRDDICGALTIATRSIWNLRRFPVPASLVRAVGIQVRLRLGMCV